jgi:nucleosome binding factor SPN SPT16 subunit
VTASKEIKDLLKKVKDMEVAAENTSQSKNGGISNDGHVEELQMIKGKKEVLENLVIRPNIVGKKTIGNLEIHQNGVRFVSGKGHNIDIPFSIIKHAFF